MNNILKIIVLASLLSTACAKEITIPMMGEYEVYEVDIKELSGLCFNHDETALLACGDKGVVKSISFDGVANEVYTSDSDMEGITIDPATGHIYLAIETTQEIHRLMAPDYNSETVVFAVQDAVDGKFANSGLEAVEFYKRDFLFVGSQKNANLWKYKLDGTMKSKISLSSFAKEIAGLCYDPVIDCLWVVDSKDAKIFLCTLEGELIKAYDIPYVDNAESICVDRARSCVWVGSDEDATKLYKIAFQF